MAQLEEFNIFYRSALYIQILMANFWNLDKIKISDIFILIKNNAIFPKDSTMNKK